LLFEDLRLIELKAIPHVLEGRDLVGCAQTGTGKTAAFVLPILQRMHAARPGRARAGAPPRTLVLSPTRELASQIGESFAIYGRHLSFASTVIFGGVGQQPQVSALRRGIDVLVATPGRLLDLMNQGFVSLERLEVFVLDEADRMLDMGFIHDVRRVIAKLPRQRQTLMFSATMPEAIRSLAADILDKPVRVDVTPVSSTAERIEQSVCHVPRREKAAALVSVLRDPALTRVLVFTRTKHGANRLVTQLERASIPAAAIHGNKSQGARERALAAFKSGRTSVLIATDIAARGIDVDGISHVINYDLPEVAEAYVHRIGRTARAGASGIAISFCDSEEREYLEQIEKLIRQRLRVVPRPEVRPADLRLDTAPAAREFAREPAAPRVHPRPAPSGHQRPAQASGHTAQPGSHPAQPSDRPTRRARRRGWFKRGRS
jgi:ATP-dependent RNA helicase RhlE